MTSEVVILGLGRHFKNEHRIRNQVRALSKRHMIYGFGASGLAGLSGFGIVSPPARHKYRVVKLLGGLFPGLRIGFESRFYRALATEISARNPSFIIAHNIVDGLIAQMSGIPFVFDSHEYLPRQFDGTMLWRSTEIRYRRKALARVFSDASLITVEGETVEEAYWKDFPAVKGRTHVVRNAPPFREKFEGQESLAGTIRMVHHGIIVPERGLEKLIKIAQELGEGYELTLMGPGLESYIDSLRNMAASAGTIRFLPPVDYDEIVPALHAYDLSLTFFGSRHYHHKFMTVPNKFWESLQARVPVVVSPLSAMARYVRETGCGLVPPEDSIDAYVQAIRSTSPARIAEMKSMLEKMAFSHSCDAWMAGYDDLLSERTGLRAPQGLSAVMNGK